MSTRRTFGGLLRQYLADANMKQNQLAERCEKIASIKVNTSIINKMVNDEHFGEGVDVISRYLQAVFTVFIAERVITSHAQIEELINVSPLRLKEKEKAEAEKAKLFAHAEKTLKEYNLRRTEYTELIGREKDIDEVVALLIKPRSQIRVVTLVGPPGVGKTELSVHIKNHPQVRSAFSSQFTLTIKENLEEDLVAPDPMANVLRLIRSHISKAEPLWGKRFSFLIIVN